MCDLAKKNARASKSRFAVILLSALAMALADSARTSEPASAPMAGSIYPAEDRLLKSPGNTTYLIDPATGDDANPAGKPWKTYARLNAMRLAPGDRVVISPGAQEVTLKPSGEGSADKPIVIQFLPGVHTIAIRNVIRLPMFVSNAQDSNDAKPIGIFLQNVRHMRLQGGGVEGEGKTTILYDGRMVEIFNDCVADVTFTNLVFDLKRPTVSEFRAIEVGPAHAVIQVAEGSDFAVKDGKFLWQGDWGPGNYSQEGVPAERIMWRSKAPKGWAPQGQLQAAAADLGERKVRLEFDDGGSGLTEGHQYLFQSSRREMVGVHCARCKNIVFEDCDFYALTGMGFVSQFTENITFRRVNVAPPKGTLRTCPAWADIFHFSNCKGEVVVDSCRLSGMQDDALNCHGTYLRIQDKIADNQLLITYAHGQTYGFAPFIPGDEAAVVSPQNLREHGGNPRRKVTAVGRKSDKDWLITLDGPAPAFEKDDVVDNITWHPNLTIRNTHVSADSVRGFLLATRGRILVEGNTLYRCHMAGILVEGDAKGWMESGPIRNLLIQKNQFIGCGISIQSPATSSVPGEQSHSNIRIADNFFDGAGISAKSVEGLTVSGNTSPAGSPPVSTKFCVENKK